MTYLPKLRDKPQLNNTVILRVFALMVFISGLLAYSGVIRGAQINTVPATDISQIHRSPEEQREANFGVSVTDWLTLFGSLEVEEIYQNNRFENARTTNLREPLSHTLQIDLEAELTQSLSFEAEFEAEYQRDLDTRVENAVLAYDLDDWAFELGYRDLPFGEYYSHFISGPLLEFGETKRPSFLIEHDLNENYGVVAYVFDGMARGPNGDSDLGWGLGMEFINDHESIRVGVGYLSNLAESDEMFLEDSENVYANKVPAWTMHVLLGYCHFELTAEYLVAATTFAEFDSSQDKPTAANIELAWFINQATQLAFRVERAKELAEQPQWQYGVSAIWRVNDHMSISAEYLRADFKNGFAIDDDQILESRHQFGLQMNFEF